MEQHTTTQPTDDGSICYDLGTFEGFNFRAQAAIDRSLTAAEVVAWDHDRDGEAEFRPSGDHAEVALIFKDCTGVTASELIALDRLLKELGGDTAENLLRIHYAVSFRGAALDQLDAATVVRTGMHLFIGTHFEQLRFDAAFELFELYFPEEFRVYDETPCNGLYLETDLFLDSLFIVEEVTLGEQVALIVEKQNSNHQTETSALKT